jgi:hypothetical protein
MLTLLESVNIDAIFSFVFFPSFLQLHSHLHTTVNLAYQKAAEYQQRDVLCYGIRGYLRS